MLFYHIFQEIVYTMPETVVLYKIVWYGVKCACILREEKG